MLILLNWLNSVYASVAVKLALKKKSKKMDKNRRWIHSLDVLKSCEDSSVIVLHPSVLTEWVDYMRQWPNVSYIVIYLVFSEGVATDRAPDQGAVLWAFYWWSGGSKHTLTSGDILVSKPRGTLVSFLLPQHGVHDIGRRAQTCLLRLLIFYTRSFWKKRTFSWIVVATNNSTWCTLAHFKIS